MSLSIREFNIDTDREDVMCWWKSQGWDSSTIGLVSPNGFVAEVDDKKVVATWVLKTDTPIYLIEWTVGNPDVSWETRDICIKALTEHACSWAKENGASATMVMTKNKRYIDKLKDNGFMLSDDGMTHLVRSL